MNNSNPFVPQGSLLEQKNKKRARVKVAVYSIFAVNILVLTPLLIQGCSKKDANTGVQDTSQAGSTQPADTGSSTASAPAPDTNNVPPALPVPPSNAAPATAMASNPVVAPPPQPVAPPPTVTPDVPATKDYVVSKGDSFYSIAKKFGVKIKDIEASNPGVVPAKLKVGQKLQIPAGGSSAGTGAMADAGSDNVYVVKPGDSLTKIAKANGVSVKTLRAANELKTDKIKVGQKLKLPAKAVAAAPVDTTTPPVTTTAATSTVPTQPIPTASAPAPTGTVTH